MSRYFSSQVSQLTPYTPGEQPKDKQYVKLNANESPYPPSPGVAAALNFAFLSYATDGRGVAFADFTYSFYPVFCDLYHIPAQIVPLREDFTLVPEDYYGLNKTIVITNPNAPTGLARLGYAIGDAALIGDLETIKFSTNPFNVNSLTMKAGIAALAEQAYYDENCKKIMETREYTARELEKLGFTVLPSKTNFLFAKKVGVDGKALCQGLKDRGVLIRHFDKDRIRDYNRITIGTPEQMDIFLEKVKELL